MRLPHRPQYVRVRLDSDMLPKNERRVLTYHHFSTKKLRRGDRVCVNDGQFKNVFGTVLGPSLFYRGFTYGVRSVRRKNIAMSTTINVEVEVA